VAAAAALAVLDTIERDGLLAAVRHLGTRLADGIAAVDHPLVDGVRGAGLLLAIELSAPVSGAVTSAALDAGFIVNAVTPDAVRLAPPFVLSDEQVDLFLDALPGILHTASAAGASA
jgi:acetylornithine aminotransferase